MILQFTFFKLDFEKRLISLIQLFIKSPIDTESPSVSNILPRDMIRLSQKKHAYWQYPNPYFSYLTL